MIIASHKCDCCGKVKGSVNRWFVIQLFERSALLQRWEEASLEDIARGQHACGQQCAVTILSGFMEEVK